MAWVWPAHSVFTGDCENHTGVLNPYCYIVRLDVLWGEFLVGCQHYASVNCAMGSCFTYGLFVVLSMQPYML